MNETPRAEGWAWGARAGAVQNRKEKQRTDKNKLVLFCAFLCPSSGSPLGSIGSTNFVVLRQIHTRVYIRIYMYRYAQIRVYERDVKTCIILLKVACKHTRAAHDTSCLPSMLVNVTMCLSYINADKRSNVNYVDSVRYAIVNYVYLLGSNTIILQAQNCIL